MLFIWIAIGAYLLFAVNAVIDKFLLHKNRISQPEAYAFAIGVMSVVVVVFAPFGFFWPTTGKLFLALFAGALGTMALYCYFSALKVGETSRVVPIQGGSVPLFTFFLAYLIAGEKLTAAGVAAIVLLVTGTVRLA